MRDVYETNLITELTQGAIINNCVSEDYCDCKVWGCVITPRCDLANEGKVSTYHYLPIIDFEFWIDKVMREMLLNDYKAGLKDKINKKLENLKAGSNLMDVFENKEDILKVGESVIKKPKEYEAFKTACSQYYDGDKEAEKEYLTEECHYKKILKDLIANGIHGYYLIESWNESSEYKVILLRDIRRMSISTRSVYENWRERGFENVYFYKRNDVSDASKQKDYYQILSCIKSPYIENIMQSFSYNFTRVGIPSFDEGIIARLSSTIKTVLS